MTNTKRRLKIEAKRRALSTMPDQNPPRSDDISYDLKGITVEMVDWPNNPYKPIFELVTSTWNSRATWGQRWKNTKPEDRMEVVCAALSGRTLPAALETVSFTFKVQGVSRSGYDQLARHRHAAIGSVGARDTCHRDASLLLPNELKRYAPEMEAWWKSTKDLYDKITQNGQESWQNARFIMPLGQQWRFTWALNYRGLQQMCAQRFCFAEQADTVATAYLHQKALAKRFPLLAVHLRLPCDLRKKCLYSQMYDLSEMFSGLFLPCGRYPTEEQPYALFNRASTNSKEISENIGMEILSLQEWEGSLEEAKELDMIYFIDPITHDQ